MTFDASLPWLPDGRAGRWTIDTFDVSDDEAKLHNMRAWRDGGHIRAGVYRRLKHGGAVWMSTTPAEESWHRPLFFSARGHALITGLGLGYCAAKVLAMPGVERVTVVEIDSDLCAYVGERLAAAHSGRVEVINADAMEWKPPAGAAYSYAWHDIWLDLCADNLPEMTKLKRRFGRKADAQGCWSEPQVRRYVRAA